MPAPQRVVNHPLTAAVATLHDLLTRLPAHFQEQQPEIERARATVDLLRERLNDAAVAAISDGALSNGHSWVQTAFSELQAAVNAGNPALLGPGTGFAANLDAISQNLGQFPMSQPTDAMNTMVEEAQRRLDSMQRAQIQQEELWRSIRDQQARLLEDAQEAKEQGLKRLREQELAAGKLLAALGAEATSTGYGTTADNERNQANYWRWFTVLGGIAASVLGVVLFLTIDDRDVASVATRTAVTLPVVLLTLYAGRQSAGHRRQEREAKRLQLAFGSVDAYLADLDPDRRADLKANLSADLYGTGRHVDGRYLADEYPSSTDLVGLLRDTIKKLR